MAGFSYRKNLDGSNQAPTLLYVIAKQGIAFSVGDAVRINTSGFVDICDAQEGMAGVLVAIVTRKGTAKAVDAGSNDTWTTSADNQTVAMDMAVFIPALPNYLFFNDADGNGSEAHIGLFYDLANSYAVDEDTHSDTTQATVRLWEYDPNHISDASQGLFQVVESQFGQDSWDRQD